MAVNIARHFDITLVQGAADAFVEGAIVTGLIPADGLAIKLTRAEIFLPLTAQTNWTREWAFARDTKLAVPTIADPDTLYSDGDEMNFTTSGNTVVNRRKEIIFPDGVYVVEPNIYVTLDSSTTGLANQVSFRIFYESVKLSEVEILRLLNNI